MLNARPWEDRLALVILTGFLVARLLFAFTIGLGVDESYTVAISRRLSLSYFDHPPLHLWIAHFAALAVGENALVRVPFVGLFLATGWTYYLLASALFGPRAGVIALFALNVTPFFFASAGSWIVPDGPLLFGLAMAALSATRLFFQDSLDQAAAWRLWLTVGLGLGFAGLSKYSAVLTACGLLAFIVVSPEERRWLKHPAPYISAILAFTMITPVVWWNARNGWASFEFQAGRGVPDGELRPAQVAIMALGQIAFLSPWMSTPLVAGLANAFRFWRDRRQFFLLWLCLPPIALFTLTPLWGGRGQPHWTMPGWFFAFALMGAWINELGVSVSVLRRDAFLASGLLAAVVGVAGLEASTGWPWRVFASGSRFTDPLLEGFAWRDLKKAPIFDQVPDFVISTKWSDAGKIALALGPQVPVFVLSDDPRGWASMDESEKYIGQNGVVVTPAADLAPTLAVAGSLFAELGPPQSYALGRRGRPEIILALIPAHGLTQRLPMPYPSMAGK